MRRRGRRPASWRPRSRCRRGSGCRRSTSRLKWADDADDRLHLERQRPAVGVAQHQVAGAVGDGGLEGAQAELGVALVAVEEVLGVDHHAEAVRRRYATESPTIATPSSSVVPSARSRGSPSTWRRCRPCRCRRRPGWPAWGRCRPCPAGAGWSRRPPASSCASFSSVRARRKNSMSFGLAPGQPPSIHMRPSRSSCSAMRSLSSTVTEMPSSWQPSRKRGVEDLDPFAGRRDRVRARRSAAHRCPFGRGGGPSPERLERPPRGRPKMRTWMPRALLNDDRCGLPERHDPSL